MRAPRGVSVETPGAQVRLVAKVTLHTPHNRFYRMLLDVTDDGHLLRKKNRASGLIHNYKEVHEVVKGALVEMPP